MIIPSLALSEEPTLIDVKISSITTVSGSIMVGWAWVYSDDYDVYFVKDSQTINLPCMGIDPKYEENYLYRGGIGFSYEFHSASGETFLFFIDTNSNGAYDEGIDISKTLTVPDEGFTFLDPPGNPTVSGGIHPTIEWDAVDNADKYSVKFIALDEDGVVGFNFIKFDVFGPIIENGSDRYSYQYVGDLFEEYGKMAVRILSTDNQTGYGSLNDSLVDVIYDPFPKAIIDSSDINMPVGETITLDGSESNIPCEDDPLYEWTVISQPAGSNTSLSNPDSVNPTFTPDQAGDYIIQLRVPDCPETPSEPDQIKLSAIAPMQPFSEEWVFVPQSGGTPPLVVNEGFVAVADIDTINPTRDILGPGNNHVIVKCSWANEPIAQGPFKMTTDAIGFNPSLYAIGSAYVEIIVSSGSPVVPDPELERVNVILRDYITQTEYIDHLVYDEILDLDIAPEKSRVKTIRIEVNPELLTHYNLGSLLVRVTAPSEDDSIPEGANNFVVESIKLIINNNPPIAEAGSGYTVHPGGSVTLDGSQSTDPDGNYDLNYYWEIVSKPDGSTAELDDPTLPNPSFTADVYGDYTIHLTVTDSLGLSSYSDEVVISTSNTVPIADAGSDQAIHTIGSTVQLNGCNSWDDDGDTLTYEWFLFATPSGSKATLSNPTICNPTFVPDVYGDYEFDLKVKDPWSTSEPDIIIVSFENVPPVAVAGNNQSVTQGDTVYLDGSESNDANNDPLTYSWIIVSKPDGSNSVIADPTSVQTNFIADMPGEYIISLVVTDGIEQSEPSNITIVAISYQNAATEVLQQTIDVINMLPDDVFKNPKNKNALTTKINATISTIAEGNYQDAIDKLEHDILGKMDGCAETGSPDKNDWIIDCDAQKVIYPLIKQAISLLTNMILP